MFMKHCLKFEWTHSNLTELTKLELSESEDFDYVCQKLGQRVTQIIPFWQLLWSN